VSHVDYRARPQLSNPVMICAFGGWNDGGEAATTAARTLRSQWGARRFAEIDPDEFFDFQVHRPTVRLIDGASSRAGTSTATELRSSGAWGSTSRRSRNR